MTLKERQKINREKMAQIDELIATGKSAKDACQTIGMATSQYYKMKRKIKKKPITHAQIQAQPVQSFGASGKLMLLIGSAEEISQLIRQKKIFLTEGQCAIFISKDWTGLKMLMPNGDLLYRRRPKNKPINPHAIKYLPSCVVGKSLHYEKALEAAIKERYERLGAYA